MKHTKKLFAIALTLIMALALTVPAFAASITINPSNPADEFADTNYETFKAYKIFDATYNDSDVTNDELTADTNISYTIAANSPFLSTIQNFKVGEGDAATAAFTLTLSADQTKYIVKANNGYNSDAAAKLAVALKAVVDAAAADDAIDDIVPAQTVSTVTGGNYVLTGLDKGYYFITSSLGSKIIVETLGTATVSTKNLYPSLTKKIVDGASRVDTITADRGNTITFEVIVSIPETAVGAITVHDELDAGMTYGSLVANAQVSEQAAACGVAECTKEFVISAETVAAVVAAEGDGGTVTFQYTATLDSDAAHATAHENDAYLTYSNFKTIKDTVSVYTYFIDVYKYTLNGDQQVGLAGAGFVLKNAEGKYYKNTDGVVTWVDAIADATEYVTRDADATAGTEADYIVTFEGLKKGTYTVVEKTVPAGYNPLDTDPTVTITDANRTGYIAQQGNQVEVLNQTGTELPSTGGIGTTIFYVVGALLMAGAGVLLVTKKRMADEE